MKILLADDHTVVRAGLRRILLEAFPQATFAEAANVGEVIELVRKKPWDVVLLDISMPGRNGLEALKEIKAERPNAAVLILSAHPEEQFAVRCLKAGAAGYLTKDRAPEELVQAINKVLSARRYVTEALAERLAALVAAPVDKAPHETLSDREFQVMLMLARGKTVKEIGGELSLSVKTISTYREHIVRKTALRNNSEIMLYAIRRGLVE
jgi:two-component system invasion response regulator UvrY